MKRNDVHKVLIIGSGPIIIGQACEFDYSGTQACKALKNLGYEIVLVNSNPATIMTDPETADITSRHRHRDRKYTSSCSITDARNVSASHIGRCLNVCVAAPV